LLTSSRTYRVDLWITKGGKSLRTVLQAVEEVQAELDAIAERA
jgi:hypothetical protein